MEARMADTKINSAGERQPVDEKSRYAEMNASEMSKELAQEIDLSDEILPRSLGAKWANYPVRMPDGTISSFVEGSRLRNKEVFAGKGTRNTFRNAEKYSEKFGGNAEDWQKVKAEATLEQDGKSFEAEVHWCENSVEGVREDFKFKRYL